MEKNFRALSLSHKHASLEVRELLALSEADCSRLISLIKEFTKLEEVLILSTCNRTEVYYYSKIDHTDTLLKLLGLTKDFEGLKPYKSYFTVYEDHNEAVDHLFRVALGLEAQVIGDLQISNQIKRAYQLSADMDMANAFLHRLMHTIFYANKRVVQETSFRDGAASVSYVAAEYAKEFGKQIINPKILVLGLGEIGLDVCRNLEGDDIDVYIANRTAEKANQVASELKLNVWPFEQVLADLNDFDVIISSIGTNEPFFRPHDIPEHTGIKYFIDLSVPRSVDREVDDLPGVIVYNIDQIQQKTNETLEKRLAAIPAVERIIAEVLQEFNEWSKEMNISPTIHKIKDALEQIRQEEMGRYLKNLTEEESKMLDKVTKNLMQKVIKLPVLQLKAACKRDEADQLIDVLNELFDLEKVKRKP